KIHEIRDTRGRFRQKFERHSSNIGEFNIRFGRLNDDDLPYPTSVVSGQRRRVGGPDTCGPRTKSTVELRTAGQSEKDRGRARSAESERELRGPGSSSGPGIGAERGSRGQRHIPRQNGCQ
ncbi:unnamed protein product, partial [Heterotrigona itama]